MGISEKNLTKLIGKNIRQKRKNLGLTQERLSEQLGITQQSLCRMESGDIAPKLERLGNLADCLNCCVIDFFRENTENYKSYSKQISEIVDTLPIEMQEYIVRHVASLAAILRLRL